MTRTVDAKLATAMVLISLWNSSAASAEKPRKIAMLKGYSGQASVQPRLLNAADWFRLFDRIEDSVQLSKEEKLSGNALMMRALGGVTANEDEQKRAEQLLNKMIARYRNASHRISVLPEVAATKPLQLGYAEYYKGAADLCQLCLLMRSGDGKFRRMTGEEAQVLMERKKILDKLLYECRLAEGMTRTLQGLPPYQLKN